MWSWLRLEQRDGQGVRPLVQVTVIIGRQAVDRIQLEDGVGQFPVLPVEIGEIAPPRICARIETPGHVLGGMGSAVAEYKATKESAPRQAFIGFNDSFYPAGNQDFVLDEAGLSTDKIVERIKEEISK